MNKKAIIQLAPLLIVIAVIIGLTYVALDNPLDFGGGFSTLSLSQIGVNSNDAQIGGQTWFLTAVQNGAGQSASVTQSINDGKGAVSDTFTLTAKLDKFYYSYNIHSDTSQIITHIDYTTKSSLTNPCGDSTWTNYVKDSFSIKWYCYKFTRTGIYGNIDNPNTNFQSTINLQGTGGSDSCSISNLDATSCTAKDGKIYVSWVGSLVSGQSPPSPQGQGIIAIYKTTAGGWITASQSSYNNWKQIGNSQAIVNCVQSQDDKIKCFNDANNAEGTLLGGKPFVNSGGQSATTTGSQSNGQIIMQGSTQTQFPVLSMRIKASLIGINIPVGQPKIISLSSEKFKTGSSGIIVATIKNIGTGIGSFNVATSCTNGFAQSGGSLTISSLGIGNSQTIYIPITSNVVTGTATGTCVVNVNDINNPNNKDSSSVSVSSDALTICSNGELRISGNTIQECKDNGWYFKEDCTPKVAQYVGDTPKCVEPNSNKGIFGFLSGLFNFNLSNFNLTFWIVTIVFSLLGFYFFFINPHIKILIGIAIIYLLIIGFIAFTTWMIIILVLLIGLYLFRKPLISYLGRFL